MHYSCYNYRYIQQYNIILYKVVSISMCHCAHDLIWGKALHFTLHTKQVHIYFSYEHFGKDLCLITKTHDVLNINLPGNYHLNTLHTVVSFEKEL